MCVCSSPRGGGSLRHGASPRGASPHGAMLRCAALALLCAALAQADRGKRAEMSPVPFVMGSRYGRSPERVMAPRNDRFFMGSRYGKRSGVVEESRGDLQGVWEGCEGVDSAHCRLMCRYAGVPHLFKCVRSHNLQPARRFMFPEETSLTLGPVTATSDSTPPPAPTLPRPDRRLQPSSPCRTS